MASFQLFKEKDLSMFCAGTSGNSINNRTGGRRPEQKRGRKREEFFKEVSLWYTKGNRKWKGEGQ